MLAACVTTSNKRWKLRPGYVPGPAIRAVAINVAGSLVVYKGVHGLALVSPHFLAVIARDRSPAPLAHRVGARQYWRPISRAIVVTHRLARGVLVERVKGHSLGVYEHFALARIAC